MKQLLQSLALSGLFIFLSLNIHGQGQLQQEAAGTIAFASDKIMQLAEALPADKYEWAPAEGVRSFANVFAHIVSANYFFASKLGAKVPDGINMQTLEQELQSKEEIVAALKESYQLADQAVKNAKDADLATKVEYPFPGEYTNMSSILILLSHSNEHLGQLIAYARMNDITPPWSIQGEE
jgi:uncharacterized damage-inducible protein DinB